MQQTINTLKSRFHFVDVQDSPDPHVAFHQTALSKHQKRLVSRLAENVQDPDHLKPEEIEKIYLQAQFSGVLPVDQLEIDPVSGRVIDRNAAVLEELCRRFRLKAETVLLWDLRSMKRGTRTVIFTAESPGSPAAVIYSRSLLKPDIKIGGTVKADDKKENVLLAPSGRNNQAENGNKDVGLKQIPDHAIISRCVRHDKLQTFIFPFDFLNILSNEKRNIILPGGEVPLGNLYVHYYSVYSNEPWTLSYEFYDLKEMDHAGFRVINLLADSTVEMEQQKNKLIIRVTPNQYHRSSFLVTADKTLIPYSAQVEGSKTAPAVER